MTNDNRPTKPQFRPTRVKKSETLEVMFSAPPMEQRVIRVIRTVTMQDDPIPMDRAMALVPEGSRDRAAALGRVTADKRVRLVRGECMAARDAARQLIDVAGRQRQVPRPINRVGEGDVRPGRAATGRRSSAAASPPG